MLAGVSLYQLMERAGAAAFKLILWLHPGARRWLVLAGNGNNGGDGYVVAQLAAAAGKQVTVLACDGQHPLPVEAEQAKAAWRAAGGEIHPTNQPWPEDVEVIIDALLGTGAGAMPGEVIRAAHTATFIALKPRLLTGKARSVTGRLHYDDLGLGEMLNRETPLLAWLSAAQLPCWLPPRDPCAHKGDSVM